jgi:hypothetical protein
MSSNSHLNIAPNFERMPRHLTAGHPMRGHLRREHLLRRDEVDVARERRIMIRDLMISVMGGISALVPMYVAVQSVMGA